MKKAFLTWGKPKDFENKKEFNSVSQVNLNIMREILNKEKYSILKEGPIQTSYKILKKLNDVPTNLLFYFTGHANKDYLGHEGRKTNYLLDLISKIPGNKTLIFDACTSNYEGGSTFEALNIPPKSKIISASQIYRNQSSIAKLLHELVLSKNLRLEDLTKKHFEDMKKNWIYFKQTD